MPHDFPIFVTEDDFSNSNLAGAEMKSHEKPWKAMKSQEI